MQIRNNGFTLVELMITLAVLAIVLGIAVPSFNAMVVNNRSTTLGQEMVVALNFARSEAVKRGTRVSICPSTDGLACLGADDWAKGWLVFVDAAVSDSSVNPIVGTPLRSWNDLPGKASVTANIDATSTKLGFFRFTGTGMLARQNGGDTDSRVFDLSVAGCTMKSKVRVTVGLSGMLSTSNIDC